MGFASGGVWGMAYCRPMGYGVQFPAHQVGGRLELWDKRGYGLPGVWVKRGSTVMLVDAEGEGAMVSIPKYFASGNNPKC